MLIGICSRFSTCNFFSWTCGNAPDVDMSSPNLLHRGSLDFNNGDDVLPSGAFPQASEKILEVPRRLRSGLSTTLD